MFKLTVFVLAALSQQPNAVAPFATLTNTPMVYSTEEACKKGAEEVIEKAMPFVMEQAKKAGAVIKGTAVSCQPDLNDDQKSESPPPMPKMTPKKKPGEEI
jgi:hypothetical protein